MREQPDWPTVRLMAAAFHLGEELGGRERFGALGDTLREIAEGRLTMLGDHIPRIMVEAGDAFDPEAASDAIAAEREAAKVLLHWHAACERYFEDLGLDGE